VSTVGYATLDVIPSVKGLAGELQKQTGGDLTRAGKIGGKRFGDAAGVEAAGGFKSRFSGAMKGFAPLAALGGGAAIVAGFRSAIEGASDLSESTSKVNVVFGEASASVLAFADDAAKGLGQSEAQALEATGTFGNLLRSVGLAEDDAAKFSTTMVTLASDLASFNNTSATEALDALRSGLVGETEPLKRFGVNMNEAVLKAKALELGLSDGKAVLDSNAKAQAAYAVIMEQTSLAQGDFARTSGGLANQSKILGAQWTELTTTAGKELLPAVTGFVSFLNDDAIPALSGAGGAAKDVAVALGDLPGPVKAAAAAFVALRIASATGLSAGIASSAASARSAIDTLRIRTMLAGDAFRETRTITREFAGATARVSSGVGRATASLNGLRAGAAGAGAAMRSGLGGAVGMLGGPWGIALIAGTALLSKFWQEQQEAKQRVEELTATLDQQTAAITDNTRETVANNLQKAGAYEAAKVLGVALSDVTDAAFGNSDAIARIKQRYDELNATDLNTEQFDAMKTLGEAYTDTSTAIDGAIDAQRNLNSGLKTSAGATDTSAGATENATTKLHSYATEIDAVRSKLQKLIDKEKERALNAIQNRRDQIALRETLKAAREEAEKGKKVLFDGSKAADANMTSLLDLADQWANSTPKVTNARGAYENMRQKFMEVATQMGATKAEAKKLADELIKVPKNVGPKFQSEGYRELLAQIAAIKSAASDLGSVGIDFTPRGLGSPRSLSTGPTQPASPGSSNGGGGSRGIEPRAGVIIEKLEAHGANLDDILRDGQRKLRRRGHGGFGG